MTEMVYDVNQFLPDTVSTFGQPTDGFLCPLSANIYKIDFVGFKIRAVDEFSGTETLLFEINKDPNDPDDGLPDDDADDSVRTIRYHFGPSFLEYKTIGTSLEFTIGDQPLHNFRMIERHYFRNRIIKSYDFTMPFVIPNTTNNWEVIYTMPELSEEDKQALSGYPWETKSDSFYFVNNALVMHNKAEYNYAPF